MLALSFHVSIYDELEFYYIYGLEDLFGGEGILKRFLVLWHCILDMRWTCWLSQVLPRVAQRKKPKSSKV